MQVLHTAACGVGCGGENSAYRSRCRGAAEGLFLRIFFFFNAWCFFFEALFTVSLYIFCSFNERTKTNEAVCLYFFVSFFFFFLLLTCIIQSMLSMSNEDLEKATPSLLGSYPNTYTFTKALAEELLVCCFFFTDARTLYRISIHTHDANLHTRTHTHTRMITVQTTHAQTLHTEREYTHAR